jgi:septal ring factor EnvC (AmiA/AmiB activator)
VALEKKLKANDLAIAKVAKTVNLTDKSLQSTQLKITELAKTKNALTIKKNQQETLLAQQLRTAYTAGHHDYLKLMLNQQQAASVQRTITYYK